MAQDKQKPEAKSKVQGEGDYDAARRYDEKTREYVKNHDVEQAARDAEPASAGEAREMERAEEQGKSRAKEEDALLEHPEEIDEEGEEGGKSGDRNPR